MMEDSGHFRADEFWDAGDLGCGELVLDLRLRMRRMPPKTTLHLIATDPGAIEDIPAWCRMTGHLLARSDHPHYLIERKSDEGALTERSAEPRSP
jgi:tRNA 2-thiouridine synthesizing protein A